MNRSFFPVSISAIVIAVLLGGCFAKVRDTRYYLLDYVPTVSRERQARGPHPWRVRIREFSVAEAYRRNQIVYRQSAHQLRFYNFELWAVKPEHLITDMVFRHMRDAHVFEHVTRLIEQEPPHFVLSGEVTAIEEFDNRNQWYAHLAMNMELLDSRTQEVVWNRAWSYRKKVMQQEVVFVVRELSFLLETIVEESLDDMDSLFTNWQQAGGRPVRDANLLERPSRLEPVAPREVPETPVHNQMTGNEGEIGVMEAPMVPPPANLELAPPENLP